MQKIIHYQFQTDQDHIQIEDEILRYKDTDKSIQIQNDQLRYIKDYIRIWFKRSLFYQFSALTALNMPMLSTALSVAFAFIAELISHIQKTYAVLDGYWKMKELPADTDQLIKETIRLYDGRLRTICRAAKIRSDNI